MPPKHVNIQQIIHVLLCFGSLQSGIKPTSLAAVEQHADDAWPIDCKFSVGCKLFVTPETLDISLANVVAARPSIELGI